MFSVAKNLKNFLPKSRNRKTINLQKITCCPQMTPLDTYNSFPRDSPQLFGRKLETFPLNSDEKAKSCSKFCPQNNPVE